MQREFTEISTWRLQYMYHKAVKKAISLENGNYEWLPRPFWSIAKDIAAELRSRREVVSGDIGAA